MSIEPEPHSQNDFGSLQGCFVEGSGEQRARERRIRRRALIISITIQSAILTAIILIPLFGKPERIALASMPIPPYYHHSASNPPPTNPKQPRPPGPHIFSEPYFAPSSIPPRINSDPDPAEPEPPGLPIGPATNSPCVGCISIDDGRRQPDKPLEVPQQKPQRLKMTHLEQAMLTYRVEPVYPALAKQIHREGRVKLHAIISTDGTIQSLQVVSGDPLFIQSATDAVRQWRYHPTVLNGQPVEIDTFITVTYSLQH